LQPAGKLLTKEGTTECRKLAKLPEPFRKAATSKPSWEQTEVKTGQDPVTNCLLRRCYRAGGAFLAKYVLLPNSTVGFGVSDKQLPSGAIGRRQRTDAWANGCAELPPQAFIGRVSMPTQAISLLLICLGFAAFVADSALGPPLLATAIVAWLVMPDALMDR
jgi:hypothetical protein